MGIDEGFVVFVVIVAAAAAMFTVLYYVIRAAVTEAMKRHTIWVRDTSAPAGIGGPPSTT